MWRRSDMYGGGSCEWTWMYTAAFLIQSRIELADSGADMW